MPDLLHVVRSGNLNSTIMLFHVATLVSLSPLSSLSIVVCIHIDQNVAEQKQCSNVYHIKTMQQNKSNVAYQSNGVI
jgi:hypothetical protein